MAPSSASLVSCTSRTRLVIATAFFCSFAVLPLIARDASAAKFHMSDGQVLEAAYIGEVGEVVTLLLSDGKTSTVAKSEIRYVDWTHKLSSKLEARAKRKRTLFTKKRKKEAERVLRDFEREKDDAERTAIAEKFEEFGEPELLGLFDDGLRSSKPHVRALALERLREFKSPGVIVPFVKSAILNPDRELANETHDVAMSRDAERTRKLYEYVSHTGSIPQRLQALQRVEQIGDRKSVPQLMWGISYVESNIRAQLVRTKEIENVPLQLGTGTNVTIDLPEVELIEVNTTAVVPVRALRRVRTAQYATLAAITGEDFGEDLDSWKRWWASESAKPPKSAENP